MPGPHPPPVSAFHAVSAAQGSGDEPVLLVERPFGEDSVAVAAEGGLGRGLGDRPVDPVLHEAPDHAVARLPPGHAGADRGHLPGRVGAEHPRELQLRVVLAPYDEEVAVVQGRGPDADDHLPRAGGGVGAVGECDVVEAEGGLEDERFHGVRSECVRLLTEYTRGFA